MKWLIRFLANCSNVLLRAAHKIAQKKAPKNEPLEVTQVRDEMVAINDGKYSGNQLMFDPESNELKVVKKGEPRPSPDTMVIDQIAEDGFFCSILN